MKVGDLVTVAPAKESVYLLVNMEAHDAGYPLPDCVTLLTPFGGLLPMNKKFVKVISEFKKENGKRTREKGKRERWRIEEERTSWMDGWIDGWMDGRTDGWMDGWIDGLMDGLTDGWMDGW